MFPLLLISWKLVTYKFKTFSHAFCILPVIQIIFPLLLTNMTYKVDVDATINGGGPTGQSGAMRWGIAWGLRSFVDTSTIERMRIGK